MSALRGDSTDNLRCVVNSVGFVAWIEGTVGENDFLDFEEPYRLSR